MIDPVPAVALRDPAKVMRLARLGSSHPCRLSFMRVLMRRLERESWRFARPVFDIDGAGTGAAVYRARGPERLYSLVCFAHDLPDSRRSDGPSATAWDATFALVDGTPDAAEIARLARDVPRQEAGRVSQREIVLGRANRSVRLFDHVVERLAAGRQPDAGLVARAGYLMRTTAVFGAGKLGAADREAIADRPEFAEPFQPEMLALYLARTFAADLVEHLARARAPETAVAFDPALRRALGLGNATGLGLAPFILNHPVLFNNWITARETALARVRALPDAGPDAAETFRAVLARARLNAAAWRSEHPGQTARLAALRDDLKRLGGHVEAGALEQDAPWDRLYRWAEGDLSLEGQEQLVSLMLEPHGDLVDDLAARMSADEEAAFRIDGAMSLSGLREIVCEVYGFALQIEWSASRNQARAWYVAAENREPRLGARFREPVEGYELPLAPARDVSRMYRAMLAWRGPDNVAAFLLRHPRHRHIARRVQIAARLPYAEIRDNTISAEMVPIDLMRCKLAFFGAPRFDPRSDRWVRINMYQGAPYPEDLADGPADDWWYPPLTRVPA